MRMFINNSPETTYVRVSYQLVKEPYSSNIRLLLFCTIIDNAKREELKLINRARIDSTTLIFNRVTFIEDVTERLFNAAENNIYAFAMIDIDNFKNINDSLGHIAGDKALHEFAQSLSKTLFRRDIIGRMGGDEFAFLVGSFSDINTLKNRIKKIHEATKIETENGIKLTTSIGIALYPDDGLVFDDLYSRADKAMYKVKENGKNGYLIYDGED